MFHLLFLASAFAAPLKGFYQGHQVVRFTVQNLQELQSLEKLVQDSNFKLDLWSHFHIGAVDIRVPVDMIQIVQEATMNVTQRVMIENVQTLIDEENIHSASLGESADIFADYQEADTLVNYLLSLPETLEINLGKTYEGRSIRGVKFGNGSKQVVFNGGIHAREWISPASVTYVANFLLSSDPKAIKMRDTFTFHVIPVLNLDGYEYTRKSDRMWRKNREPNQGSRCIGTDPNRNFDLAWSKPGASSSACADNYYGSAPNSSAEARNLINYISSLSNVISYFDFHAYSQLWMYAWSYTCNSLVPDEVDLGIASKNAVAALKAVNGLVFKSGPICKTIYQASGTTVDYMYSKLKVKYSMAVELRDTGRYGFVLPATQIVPAGEETLQGLLAFWDYVSNH
jgi:murein tripeptide amidase MpaA